jgi:beta-ribofuranosylaminobenzene 5'-phosphate synthase
VNPRPLTPGYLEKLFDIEDQTGPVSEAVKALLITDGSVTRLLECFTGTRVSIRTLIQQVIPSPPDIAEEMQISAGDPVNYRVVEICDGDLRIPLIHAVSYCPPGRLPDHARTSLMQADIPIGNILRDEKMESRREITGIRTVPPDHVPQFIRKTGTCRRLFSRKYQIIHNNLPIFRIEEYIPDTIFRVQDRVAIRTPSRLHLTLIDMNGSCGRVDGGVGITLSDPGYVIEIERSDQTSILTDDGDLKKRVLEILNHLSRKTGFEDGLSVRIHASIPPHAGLGSGTQLALALASAISHLSGMPDSDPARLTGRGGTSGIGVRSFTHGGVILDGGHRFGPGMEKESFLPSSAAKGVKPAPLVGRYDFPDTWRIILCLPDLPQGANGDLERDIFREKCPVPLSEVRELSHRILMQMVPALIEEDLDQFGKAVNALRYLGFKKEELALQPPQLHDILDYMTGCGTAGAGMSSFGPALYAITDTDAGSIAGDIRAYLDERCGGEVRVVRGQNSGASVRG